LCRRRLWCVRLGRRGLRSFRLRVLAVLRLWTRVAGLQTGAPGHRTGIVGLWIGAVGLQPRVAGSDLWTGVDGSWIEVAGAQAGAVEIEAAVAGFWTETAESRGPNPGREDQEANLRNAALSCLLHRSMAAMRHLCSTSMQTSGLQSL
jgi:hypothetical protein